MTPRINNAINVFLNALETNTLAKGSCVACAVGNLVAAGLNGRVIDKFHCTIINTGWSNLFATSDGEQHIRLYANTTEIQKEIDSTNFSIKELMKIEFAFETNTKIHASNYHEHSSEEIRADQLKGLEAVIEVMLDFDDVKESVQDVFTSKAELVPVI